MSKFKRGVLKSAAPTKGELQEMYEDRFKAISSAVQQVLMLASRQNQALASQLAELSRQVETVDFRSLATMDLLAEKGILTKDAHLAYVEAARIKEFEDKSAEDDKARNLTPAEGPVKIGQFVTIQMSAHDAETGESIERLTVFRSKVQVGSGDLHPTLEQEFIGMEVGKAKEFTIELPPEFQGLAGKKVKFGVTVLDLKNAPQPEAATAEEPPKAEDEEK